MKSHTPALLLAAALALAAVCAAGCDETPLGVGGEHPFQGDGGAG